MLKFEKILITPALAERYLQANIQNRRIKEPVVLRYANDIKNGRWKQDTGETIKISKSGIVLDGQHRLKAIIKANTPVWFYVTTGLEDEVFDVLDTGSSRNASDAFKIAGVLNENIIPSIMVAYNSLKDGYSYSTQKHFRKTNAELLKDYYDDEIFWEAVAKKSINWYNQFAKILPPSSIGGFYAFFYKINFEKSESFMNQLCTGIDIENNVIALLRTKLMQDKMSVRKMNIPLKYALIIRTWNHFIKGTTPKILKFDTEREDFPEALKF